MISVGPEPSPRSEQAGAWCLSIAEGPLTPEQMTEFEVWLGADALNRAAFDKALFVWEAMDPATASSVLLDYRLDALQSLRDESASRPVRASGWRWAARAAASFLILLLASLLFLHDSTISYETGTGERRVAVLPDGSRVSLDGATSLEADFSPHRRELRLLVGRAKFDVARDPLRPFVVKAGERSVVAVGTSFTVELVQGQLRVALYEGEVAVIDERGDRQADRQAGPQPVKRADRRLLPGRELVLSGQHPAGAIVPITNPHRSLAWETGQLHFDDEPLAMVVERINRHTADRFVVGDAAAAQMRVSGVFDAGDANSFVEGVTGVFPISAHRRGSEIVFVARAGRRNLQVRVPQS